MNVILDNLVYIVSAVCVPIISVILKNPRQNNNDLTQYVIKYNKQQEALNKRSKSIFS